ncbi:hypothetical protein EDB19DRAFT_1775556 [Suillus lakei]|nr:hypothetical protein EDB19DRAFT_1775556 [Suillus lakei]
MGNALSLIRLALTEFLNNLHTLQTLQARIQRSPGLPLPNPSRSFWSYPPSPIATHVSQLPTHADFVVIGSGITGTSVVRRLLDSSRADGHDVQVLMLEARDACSGATGRNGGHISPPLYHDYTSLKRDHGQPVAQKMMKLRLAHLEELRSVAEQEGILAESQWREVESVDVFYNSDMFEKAKTKVQTYKADLPFDAKHHEVYEAKEAIEKYRLASDTLGCISSSAGAIHPYQFILTLHQHTMHLHLTSNTLHPYYTLSTPRGIITTPHIIHATNGWASTLLEKFRGKIIPFRGNIYGNTDDTTYSKRIGAHCLDNWGKEGVPLEGGEGEWAGGRVRPDLIPWVGRLPRVASGRSEPPLSSVVKSEKEGVGERVHVGAAPGEWIAAGYSGEGMVHAWLSGKALTEMMLGREVEGRLGEWFPDIMRVTEKRWKKAKAENLLDALDDD